MTGSAALHLRRSLMRLDSRLEITGEGVSWCTVDAPVQKWLRESRMSGYTAAIQRKKPARLALVEITGHEQDLKLTIPNNVFSLKNA
jgi:hypothetical protein